MTPIELVDALLDYLNSVVRNYNLPTKKHGEYRQPKVHSGYLPDKKKEDESSDFPYVIVRFLSEQDSDIDKVNLRLIIATYSEDEVNGWRDPVNIATRIKIDLKKKKVFGPFVLDDSIKIELFEEHPFPQWFSYMDLSFVIPQVNMDWSEHNFEF